MVTINSRSDTKLEYDKLGIVLMTHRKAAPWSNVAAWGNLLCRLRGEPLLFSDTTFLTLYPRVLHPSGINPYDSWIILAHERVHWERQRDLGLYRWVWRYVVSHKFRFEEEAIAYLEDIRLGRLVVGQVVTKLIENYGIDTIPKYVMYNHFEQAMK